MTTPSIFRGFIQRFYRAFQHLLGYLFALKFGVLVSFVFVLLISQYTWAQVIGGRVSDEADRPVPGAAVQVVGTNVGVSTNAEGQFSLSAASLSFPFSLRVSHIGYFPQTLSVKSAEQDISFRVKERTLLSDDVVVTATRTAKLIEETATPVQLITKEAIEKSGVVRLDKILLEQAGFTIVAEPFGSGIQLQGLDPDYTMILVDGEPLIGRSGGALDLSRVTLGNVKRIEIVKGPSSALWGSEALAGVINIITDRPESEFGASVSSRYATNNALDLSTKVEAATETFSQTIFFNRNSSDGFDLTSNAGQTAPPFLNFTVNSKSEYRLGERSSVGLSGKYFREDINAFSELGTTTGTIAANDEQVTKEWSLNPTFTHQFRGGKFYARYYATQYDVDNTISDISTGDPVENLDFRQTYQKGELQSDVILAGNQLLTGGAGYVNETVDSPRFGGDPQFNAGFAYLQHDWDVTQQWNVTSGFRYDIHSEYNSQISPKLATRYEINDRWAFRLSGGRGFKAPDFRQLLLNFTNSVAGYSIFGSDIAQESIIDLQERGQIARLFFDPTTLEAIKAERSWSLNAGIDFNPNAVLQFKVNLFRNDIRDMIDTRPVAQKSNGANVFTYVNLNHVVTQGVEVDAKWQIHRYVQFKASYQYLDSRDVDVLNDIRDGRVFRRNSQGRTERVSVGDYGGLFNRSKHMGAFMIFANQPVWKVDASLRAQFRSRFGFGDLNANQVLDIDEEYADGYMIWNLAAGKSVGKYVRLQAGVDNVFDYTDAQNLPFIAGRLIYGGLTVQF